MHHTTVHQEEEDQIMAEGAVPGNTDSLMITTSVSTPTTPSGSKPVYSQTIPPIMEKKERDESWKKYLTR